MGVGCASESARKGKAGCKQACGKREGSSKQVVAYPKYCKQGYPSLQGREDQDLPLPSPSLASPVRGGSVAAGFEELVLGVRMMLRKEVDLI